MCVSELEGTELLVNGQDVVVELCGEQEVLQRSHVLLDGHMVLQNEERHHVIERTHTLLYCGICVCVCVLLYHEEDLLQPLDAVFVPGRADVDAARLTANQMLRQQHDETLREGKTTFKGSKQTCVKACV